MRIRYQQCCILKSPFSCYWRPQRQNVCSVSSTNFFALSVTAGSTFKSQLNNTKGITLNTRILSGEKVASCLP